MLSQESDSHENCCINIFRVLSWPMGDDDNFVTALCCSLKTCADEMTDWESAEISRTEDVTARMRQRPRTQQLPTYMGNYLLGLS